MSLFARLNFDPTTSNDNVTDFTESTKKHMQNVPPILNDWQIADMSSGSVGGYFVNPVDASALNIKNASINIESVEFASNVANLSTIFSAANALITTAQSFREHTDRISGVVPVNINTTSLPHYDTATGVGKVMMYIVYQSDGVENTAPLMGNFTSLFIKDDLDTYYQTIQSYPNTISNSINTETSTDPMTMESVTVYTTNLTPSMVSTMANTLVEINNLMDSRETNDVAFYQNSRTIVDEYNSLKQFSNMGLSETYLVKNLVGSSKLLSRINS